MQDMKHRMQITHECWEWEYDFYNGKPREVYATNDFSVVRRWQWCL